MDTHHDNSDHDNSDHTNADHTNARGTTQLMRGKRGVVMGLANDRSIAWGITRALASAGAEIALSYASPSLEKRVRPLAESINCPFCVPCDVSDDQSVHNAFQQVQQQWGTIDFLVHSIAFADKNELRGPFMNTSRANFAMALDISCYSLVAVTRAAAPLMNPSGSVLTLTYFGAERVIPNYNVMGVAKAALEASVRYLAYDLGAHNVRVNAISAGPIRTLAASGIGDIQLMMQWNAQNAPLGRNVSQLEVGQSALFLLSDLSSGITGECLYVDSGYHIMGMADPKHAQLNAQIMQQLAQNETPEPSRS